jgi:large subunit ribosomal protein L19
MDIVAASTKKYVRTDLPEIKSGQTVKVHQLITEEAEGKQKGKERVQVFEGIVIAVKHGKTTGATFTVRKKSGEIGVERIFPLHGPMIKKVEIMKAAQVRRSKLYFIRADKKRRKFKEAEIK